MDTCRESARGDDDQDPDLIPEGGDPVVPALSLTARGRDIVKTRRSRRASTRDVVDRVHRVAADHLALLRAEAETETEREVNLLFPRNRCLDLLQKVSPPLRILKLPKKVVQCPQMEQQKQRRRPIQRDSINSKIQ